jgi:HEAT repeat protein
MFVTTTNRIDQKERIFEIYPQISPANQIIADPRVKQYLADLSPETPWGNRQDAAKNLGNLKAPSTVPGLLAALKRDDFWMVRCAIIQSLEKIADPRAIPVLIQVSQADSFQVVRSYAAKAVERLSRK